LEHYLWDGKVAQDVLLLHFPAQLVDLGQVCRINIQDVGHDVLELGEGRLPIMEQAAGLSFAFKQLFRTPFSNSNPLASAYSRSSAKFLR
jgi:hypothetical protein